MSDFTLARRNMVECQLRPNRVTVPEVVEAFAAIPRELFLPETLRAVAYADDDVPLGNGRWLMEPMVLGRLIQALQPAGGKRALAAAAGQGYGAAILGRLCETVVAVEADPAMADAATAAWKALGIENVRSVCADPEKGESSGAPYDIVLVEGAVRLLPPALLEQMAEGGRLACVIAGPPGCLGVAQLFVKAGGVVSGRPLFDAGTPALPGFAPPPKFTF